MPRLIILSRTSQHQNFPNLDALAAGPQRVFHRFPRPDYADAAQTLRKFHPLIRIPRRRFHDSSHKWQETQAGLYHDPIQSIRVETKVVLAGGSVPNDGVHAPNLVIGRHHRELRIELLQVVGVQLDFDVLGDQINRNDVVVVLPRNNDIGLLATWNDELIKSVFYLWKQFT